MLIFPQPQRMELLDGEYRLPGDLAALPLVDFFRAVALGIL